MGESKPVGELRAVIDYKSLLFRYMKLVVREEGADFTMYAAAPEFAADEVEELKHFAGLIND